MEKLSFIKEINKKRKSLINLRRLIILIDIIKAIVKHKIIYVVIK